MSQDAFIYVICDAAGNPASQYIYLRHEAPRANAALGWMKKSDPIKYADHEVKKFKEAQ